jgi:ACS family hexuronate transporter-like MFS transporter
VVFAESIDSVWLAVLVIGVATAGHQAFSANLYALPSDLFPRGAVGGILMAFYAGEILDRLGVYWPLFWVAGSAYFIALLVVHLLSPRLEPVRVDAV